MRNYRFLLSWKAAKSTQQKKIAKLEYEGFREYDKLPDYVVLRRKWTFATVFANGEKIDGIPV